MRFILIALFVSFALQSYSQDIIFLNNGDEIKAKVLEIHKTTIDYKRFSNIDGPSYHFDNSEIFMIKYASGEKDLFNTKNSTSSAINNIQSNPLASDEFVYDVTIGNSNCKVQKSRGAKIYGDRVNEVYFREDIVFYGYDFTYLKLSNAKKMGQSFDLIQNYFNAWNTQFNKDYGFAKLKKCMGKPSMLMGNQVFQNYNKRDFYNFVDLGNYCISFEDLQKIVNSYVINETQGIGMVINLVNFNKNREFSMAWVTFFDIKTREIMFAVLTTGEAGGAGMVGHWANGVEKAVLEIFVNEIFKHKLNNNAMIPKKLRLY